MTTTPPEQPPTPATPVEPTVAPAVPAVPAEPRRSRASTMSLWLAIGALVAAAILGGYFIIAGDQANVAGRAWLTLLLVAFFAGAVVLDARVGDGPNRWYVAASTIVNVVLVTVGLLKLWNGWLQPADTADPLTWMAQGGRLLLIVILLRLALLFTQLYGLNFVTRARSLIGRAMGVVTIAFVWVAILVLAIPAAFPQHAWPDWWWRVAGAAALVAVVTTVIPLLVRAFEPKAARPAASVQAAQQQAAQQQYAAQQYAQQQYAAQQYAAQQQAQQHYAQQQAAAQQQYAAGQAAQAAAGVPPVPPAPPAAAPDAAPNGGVVPPQ